MEPEIVKHFKAQTDFFFFCKEVLGYKKDEDIGYYDLNSVHKELCDFLQHDKKKSKIILMPRHSIKSQIITVGHSLWKLVKNPNLRILIYSDSQTKASGFLSGIKSHIEGKAPNSKFREMYPKWETQPRGGDADNKGTYTDSRIVISARTYEQKDPTIDTGGIDTSKTGMHFDIIFFDDIVSDANTTTKVQMDKVHACYKKALSLLKPGGEVFIVGTRWHFGDAYGRIIDDNKERDNFSVFIRDAEMLNKDGKLLFEDVGLDQKFLDYQRQEQGSYLYSCNPFEAPIMMEDFTCKPIGTVEEGETVIGWVRKENNRTQLVKSKVLKVQSRIAPIVKIKLESGREIRCTPDHNWWTGRCPDGTHREYKPASVGGRLMYLFDPYLPELNQKERDLAKWLGGFYDGEGNCIGSISISQSEIKNADVCRKLETALDTLDFKYNSSIRQPSDTAMGQETRYYWINGGIEGKRKFALYCSPVKKCEIFQSMLNYGSRFIKERDKVVSIEDDGEDEVFALQTETGNYIAWGYGSKNCLYRNNPVDDETAMFKAQDFKFYMPNPDFAKRMYITGTCDPAGEGQDYTAITVVGTDYKKRMFVLEAINKHLKPNQIVDTIIRLNYKWGFDRFGVERNFFKGMLEKDFKRAVEDHRMNSNWKPFVFSEDIIASKKQQNRNRILALQPFHERGDLFLPNTAKEPTLNTLGSVYSEMAFQMLQYTINGSKSPHDDLLMSLAMHIDVIQKGGKAQAQQAPKNSPAWLERQWIENHNALQRRKPRGRRTIYHPVLS